MARLKTKSFIEWIQNLLVRAETEGMNYHDQMVQIAFILIYHKVPYPRIIELMHLASESVTRRKPRVGEIEGIVGWAGQNEGVGGKHDFKRPSKKVRRNQDIIDEWRSKGSVKALMARSGAIPKKSEVILKELFEQDSLLHLSPDIFRDHIKPLHEWIAEDLTNMQYLCPCSFKDRQHGRLAKNVLQRKYVVFETDDLPDDWDGQAGLIERLAQEQRLILICWSGRASLHAWFRVDGDQKSIEEFENLAITLSGDPAVIRRPAQMVRFPWGKNTKTGNQQQVIYFNNG
jgi:hypothetical protein